MSEDAAPERLILVLHGPNLNLLGRREPDIYGRTTLAEINEALVDAAVDRGVQVVCRQSNFEGELIELVHEYGWSASGIIINPGAFTHYSIAIRDAIAAVSASTIEIHLSNTTRREEFRHHSVIAPVALGSIAGLGASGYMLALHYLMDAIDLREAATGD